MKGKYYFLQEVLKTTHGILKVKDILITLEKKRCDLNNFDRSNSKIVTVPRVTSHPNFPRKNYYYNYKKRILYKPYIVTYKRKSGSQKSIYKFYIIIIL